MASPASSDEGEIRDTGVELEKANSSLLELDGTSVDRQDRTRSRSSNSQSPSFDSGSSLRGRRYGERDHPYYADHGPRGSKRSRDDDHYDHRHTDPRRFKVHYEDRTSDRRRARVSYDDLDNGSAHPTDLRYDDRYPEKRPRTRSRSPYRAPRGDERRDRGGYGQKERGRYDGPAGSGRPGSYGHEGQNGRTAIDQSVNKRADGPMPGTDVSKREAKSAQGYQQQHTDSSANGVRSDRSRLATEGNKETAEAESEPLDEAALIEQRRKRREAIKAKYRGSATPLLSTWRRGSPVY